jgi:hypothetical protein
VLDRVNKPAPEIIPETTYLETKEPGFQKAGMLIRGVIVAVGLVALGAFIFASKPGPRPVAADPQATQQLVPQNLQPAPGLAPAATAPAVAAPVSEPKAAPAPKPAPKPPVARRAPAPAVVTPPAAVTQPIPEVVAPAEPEPVTMAPSFESPAQ